MRAELSHPDFTSREYQQLEVPVQEGVHAYVAMEDRQSQADNIRILEEDYNDDDATVCVCVCVCAAVCNQGPHRLQPKCADGWKTGAAVCNAASSRTNCKPASLAPTGKSQPQKKRNTMFRSDGNTCIKMQKC